MVRKLPEVMSFAEFERILEVTKKKNHRLAFKLGFVCGLRVSEIVNLKPIDIKWEVGFIKVLGKGSKERSVPIYEPVKKDLKHLPVGCGVRALEIAFKKAVERAEIKRDLHFHTLRHSCATFYLNKGMDLKEVQQLLGHSRLDTTGIYLHVSPEQLKKQGDEIWK